MNKKNLENEMKTMEFPFVTVRQIANTPGCPFSEASLRWMIFRAKENGLEPALSRVGHKLLIHKARFMSWLEEGLHE